ncbi:MAG: nuclear transport factor 2 family protein [Pseudomonadota bacterium]
MIKQAESLFHALLLSGLSLMIVACSNAVAASQVPTDTPQLRAAANIVDAVNNKDAQQYIRDLHPEVIVKMYDGDIRLSGVEAVLDNRTQHFLSHPEAHNALIHLVEIDNRVVMHDMVWLNGKTDGDGSNIVEVFTFEDGLIKQIDVLQPSQLFQPTSETEE